MEQVLLFLVHVILNANLSKNEEEEAKKRTGVICPLCKKGISANDVEDLESFILVQIILIVNTQ